MTRFAVGPRAGAFAAADDRRERHDIAPCARTPDARCAVPIGARAWGVPADSTDPGACSTAACFPEAFTPIAPAAATHGERNSADAASAARSASSRPSPARDASQGRVPGVPIASFTATGASAVAHARASGDEPAGDDPRMARVVPAGRHACSPRTEPGTAIDAPDAVSGVAHRSDTPPGNEALAGEPPTPTPSTGGAPAGERAASGPASGALPGHDAETVGCPVFLAGVPIDEAGACWLTDTARAARAGEDDAALALWLALRPRFARWAAACLDRTSAADLRRDGAPWLLDDLVQEGYLVLLGVVADWPDRDRDAEPGAIVPPATAATGGRSGAPIAADAPDPDVPSVAALPGDGAAGERAFLPWLFAVAPRRLYGALATLRDRAGRSPGDAARTAPLAAADLLADGTSEAAEAAARLAAIAATLDPIDGALLLAHVADREPIVLAGRRLGLDRGAAYHRWHRTCARLRDELVT